MCCASAWALQPCTPARCGEAMLVALFRKPLPHQDPEVRGQHVLSARFCSLVVHAVGVCRLRPREPAVDVNLGTGLLSTTTKGTAAAFTYKVQHSTLGLRSALAGSLARVAPMTSRSLQHNTADEDPGRKQVSNTGKLYICRSCLHTSRRVASTPLFE